MIVNRFGWAVGLSCVSSGVRVKLSIMPLASVARSRPRALRQRWSIDVAGDASLIKVSLRCFGGG